MKIRDNKVMAALLAATVVVGGVNIAAYAGGGHAFLLGRHNTEKKASVLKNKHKGAALTIVTKKSSPPLKVDSKKRVKHLNADAVDGKSAGALETKMWTFPVPEQSGKARYDLWLNALPVGSYWVRYSLYVDDEGEHAGEVTCGIETGGSPRQGVTSIYLAGDSLGRRLTGVAPVVVAPHVTPRLVCDDDEGGSFVVNDTDGAVSSIDFTRVDTVVQGTSTLN